MILSIAVYINIPLAFVIMRWWGPAVSAEVREDTAPRTQYLSHLWRPNFELPWARHFLCGPHVMGGR